MGFLQELDKLWDKLRDALGQTKKFPAAPIPIPSPVPIPSPIPPSPIPTHPVAGSSIGSRVNTPPALSALGYSAYTFTKGALWKPTAEDNKRHVGFITIKNSFHKQKLKVFAFDGTVLGDLNYYGTYEGGGHRWYSGTDATPVTAKQFDEMARAHGNGTVYVEWEPGVVLGPIKPLERNGSV